MRKPPPMVVKRNEVSVTLGSLIIRFLSVGPLPSGRSGSDKSSTLEFRRLVDHDAALGGFIHHPHDVTPLPRRRHGSHIVTIKYTQQFMNGIPFRTRIRVA